MNRTLVSYATTIGNLIHVLFPGKEREKGKEKLLGEIMAKIIPNMINLWTHKSKTQETPSARNIKKTTSRHSKIKLLKK